MAVQILDSWFFHPATATYEDAVAKFSQMSAPQVLFMPPAHSLRVLDVHRAGLLSVAEAGARGVIRQLYSTPNAYVSQDQSVHTYYVFGAVVADAQTISPFWQPNPHVPDVPDVVFAVSLIPTYQTTSEDGVAHKQYIMRLYSVFVHSGRATLVGWPKIPATNEATLTAKLLNAEAKAVGYQNHLRKASLELASARGTTNQLRDRLAQAENRERVATERADRTQKQYLDLRAGIAEELGLTGDHPVYKLYEAVRNGKPDAYKALATQFEQKMAEFKDQKTRLADAESRVRQLETLIAERVRPANAVRIFDYLVREEAMNTRVHKLSAIANQLELPVEEVGVALDLLRAEGKVEVNDLGQWYLNE